MRNSRTRAIWCGLVGATALILGMQAPVNAAATHQVGAPSDRLQVWNVNTHRMATTGTDIDYFADYITDPSRVAYYPDIVTLQEAGTDISSPPIDAPSCHNFEHVLESRTGQDYYCYETTLQGGAAIVYRTGRLSHVGSPHDVRLKEVATDGPTCSLSPWYAITLRLSDDQNSGKYVNVAAVHLPVRNFQQTDNIKDCTWDNEKIVSPAVTGLGSASMQIMAGDWNHRDATTTSSGAFDFWECSYSGMNVDLGTCGGRNFGWKDAMYRACGWPTAGSTAEYNCLHANHWTHGSHHDRIDFLFVKTYAIYHQTTVSYADAYASAGSPPAPAPTDYSDHRGQGALLRYY